MKIEKLTDDKIKVTLTMTDLTNLDIDVERLSPDSKELHAFLFTIMETIREETGFNPYSGQVVVEATPSNDGMSITVSRMKPKSGKITREEFKKHTSVRASIRKDTAKDIFLFNNFEHLCMAITEVHPRDLSEACLYKLNDGYCITVKKVPELTRCSSIIREFALWRLPSSSQSTYINEHGKLIAKGSSLVNMAQNIRNLK